MAAHRFTPDVRAFHALVPSGSMWTLWRRGIEKSTLCARGARRPGAVPCAGPLGPDEEPAVRRAPRVVHEAKQVFSEVLGDLKLGQELACILILIKVAVEDVQRRVVALRGQIVLESGRVGGG